MGLESLLLGKYLSPVNTLVSGLNSLYSAAAAKSLQSCLTLCDPIDRSPPGSPSLDSPGKNTGVGCHFLLQHMKVKSESEVAQSCPTLSNPMDCSPPGSSVHGIFQARVLEWGAIVFSEVSILGHCKTPCFVLLLASVCLSFDTVFHDTRVVRWPVFQCRANGLSSLLAYCMCCRSFASASDFRAWMVQSCSPKGFLHWWRHSGRGLQWEKIHVSLVLDP